MRKKYKADQTDYYREESINMKKKNPWLAQAQNPKNNNPHGNRFKIFDT